MSRPHVSKEARLQELLSRLRRALPSSTEAEARQLIRDAITHEVVLAKTGVDGKGVWS